MLSGAVLFTTSKLNSTMAKEQTKEPRDMKVQVLLGRSQKINVVCLKFCSLIDEYNSKKVEATRCLIIQGRFLYLWQGTWNS